MCCNFKVYTVRVRMSLLDRILFYDQDIVLSFEYHLFLPGAKAGPHSWVPFYYLGEYYQRTGQKQDLNRARKCFEKSYSLNPYSREAGSALSDIYFKQVSTIS